ncbi:MAG TPA: winged helix-turn-helix domain-containing protein, partial [Blastocatellia bacterium]
MSGQNRQIYQFDNFRLDAAERLLLRDGQPVALPSKAFDLLVVLVENRGRLVEKETLYQRVWTDQIVEESNLTVQMSAIRKALGERKENPRYIATVSGRGYRFTGDVMNPDRDAEVVIETETLSRVVIEKEAEADGLRIVNAESRLAHQFGAITSSQGMGLAANKGKSWRWTESSQRRNMLAAVGVAVGLVLLVYYLWSKQAAPPTQLTSPNQIKSIAVLPFKPLIADSRDEVLEMGMADTLIARLSNIREINVRPI